MSKIISLPIVRRPVTRGDCADVPRPCPFSSCRYHLELNDTPPKRQRGQRSHHAERMANRRAANVTESCALDVADRGGIGPLEVARYMGTTDQHVSIVEERALAAMREDMDPVDYD